MDRTVASLGVARPGFAPRVVVLERDVTTLGRDAKLSLCLNDAGVSRRHGMVIRGPDGSSLRDLGSRNGLYLNGRRLASGVEVPLRHGDRVQAGQTVLLYQETAVAPAAEDLPALEPYATQAPGASDAALAGVAASASEPSDEAPSPGGGDPTDEAPALEVEEFSLDDDDALRPAPAVDADETLGPGEVAAILAATQAPESEPRPRRRARRSSPPPRGRPDQPLALSVADFYDVPSGPSPTLRRELKIGAALAAVVALVALAVALAARPPEAAGVLRPGDALEPAGPAPRAPAASAELARAVDAAPAGSPPEHAPARAPGARPDLDAGEQAAPEPGPPAAAAAEPGPPAAAPAAPRAPDAGTGAERIAPDAAEVADVAAEALAAAVAAAEPVGDAPPPGRAAPSALEPTAAEGRVFADLLGRAPREAELAALRALPAADRPGWFLERPALTRRWVEAELAALGLTGAHRPLGPAWRALPAALRAGDVSPLDALARMVGSAEWRTRHAGGEAFAAALLDVVLGLDPDAAAPERAAARRLHGGYRGRLLGRAGASPADAVRIALADRRARAALLRRAAARSGAPAPGPEDLGAALDRPPGDDLATVTAWACASLREAR